MTNRETCDTFRDSVHAELYHNILPFWIAHVLDEENGGFWGALTNDLRVDRRAPRSVVVAARLLWTYATATRVAGSPLYRQVAERLFNYLEEKFWDGKDGGAFWRVDQRGHPLDTRKLLYGQAFTIYALAEYFRTTQDPRGLARAQTLYALVEEKAADADGGGYLEHFDARWAPAPPDPEFVPTGAAEKSMNTHLHMLEAYTALYRVWRTPDVAASLRQLFSILLNRIVDPQTWHFRLFFDRRWTPLPAPYSYGHDIEGSWLIGEAAETLEDEALSRRVADVSVQMARVTLAEGVDEDGALFYEGNATGATDTDKHWWPQAEAMVGFLNAYQLTGDARFFAASYNCWRFIQNTLVDKENGEWFAKASREGKIYPDPKVSPWKGPYHNGRACFEVLARLDRISTCQPPTG